MADGPPLAFFEGLWRTIADTNGGDILGKIRNRNSGVPSGGNGCEMGIALLRSIIVIEGWQHDKLTMAGTSMGGRVTVMTML